jgi:hypothetical protein
MLRDSQRTKLTPPELARHWGVSADKILSWIKSGELRATNLATSRTGRPRWKIDLGDALAFEEQRAAAPSPPRRRRKRMTDEIIAFF